MNDVQECTKVGYRDKFAAQPALGRARHKRHWSGGKWTDECRIYKCHCGKYHLTSQPRRRTNG